MSKSTSEIGVLGLGVMGSALSLNFADRGFSVSVYNRDEGRESGTVDQFLERIDHSHSVLGFTDLPEFIGSLEPPRRIFMMISADAVDQVIQQTLPLLEAGDVLMDGGNSHYKKTKERLELCRNREIEFLGVGISGGEKGARFGPSIMPGGSEKGFRLTEKYLGEIAARDKNGEACIAFIGPEGAGHFVKMVHNGIEYVEMQLLAEIYQLLRSRYSKEQLADLFSGWNESDLHSYLLEITSKIFRKKEADNDLIDLILDKAGNKGTGGWGTMSALELGTDNSMMSAAVFARYVSSQKETRKRLGSPPKIEHDDPAIDIKKLKTAYDITRRLNHLQGFELISNASNTFNWDINLSEVARIWTNGCIIRSNLMEEMTQRFKTTGSLLQGSDFLDDIRNGEDALSEIIQTAVDSRTAIPAFASAWNYWAGITTSDGPANLIQAQRDFFGAHRYQRTDDPSGTSHHTNWEE